MDIANNGLVDWVVFGRARAELGTGFVRILSYFKEDGAKSIAQIELAMRDTNATALVMPAHTLKGEARQFGAEPLAAIAEVIEMTARRCVEQHESPEELVAEVVRLRPMFAETLTLFEREAVPIPVRRPTFGRKPASFGTAARS